MNLQIHSTGRDDFGPFQAFIPGRCQSCDADVDVVVKYNATRLLMDLKKRGIDPDAPSIIIKKPWQIGVTCGCYARFHRQVAHIQRRKKTTSRDDKKYG